MKLFRRRWTFENSESVFCLGVAAVLMVLAYVLAYAWCGLRILMVLD